MNTEKNKFIDNLIEKRLEMMDNSVRDAFTILLEIHSERRFITSLIYLKDEKTTENDYNFLC